MEACYGEGGDREPRGELRTLRWALGTFSEMGSSPKSAIFSSLKK
jgi:hypothetical protein